jgi:hypothetical protein
MMDLRKTRALDRTAEFAHHPWIGLQRLGQFQVAILVAKQLHPILRLTLGAMA